MNLQTILEKIASFFKSVFVTPALAFIRFMSSWGHLTGGIAAAIILLYYPLGGYFLSNVDRNINVTFDDADMSQSATVNMMSFIIDREVNDKLWTPNLPFIFPTYFLDNMPNFQLGIFSSLANFAEALSKCTNNQNYISESAKLLKYPGDIWMFSPNNHLVPVSSANSQYRKARKYLVQYNETIIKGGEIFVKKQDDLSFLLKNINADLAKSSKQIEDHVRELSPALIDGRADNVFYYNQGKVYSYFLLLNALGRDYKDIIIEKNLYQTWTKLIKSLEDASSLSPSFVRNGELNSLTAPNHLSYLNLNILKAQNTILKLTAKLDTK